MYCLSFGNIPSDLLFAGEGQKVMMDTGVFQKGLHCWLERLKAQSHQKFG